MNTENKCDKLKVIGLNISVREYVKMKNKLKKVGIIILSLGLLCVPVFFQGVGMDVQASGCGPVLGYDGSRDVIIHTKTKVITGMRRGKQIKAVKAVFPNGKTIKVTIADDKCAFSLPIPTDIKLVEGMKIRMTYTASSFEYSEVKTVRRILDAPKVNPWKDGQVITGTGLPRYKIDIEVESRTYQKSIRETVTAIADTKGNWSAKLKEKHTSPTITAVHHEEDDLIETEKVVYHGTPLVYSIAPGDRKIFFEFNQPVKAIFTNGKVVTASPYKSIDVPNDITLKAGDKVHFVGLKYSGVSDEIEFFSPPMTVTVRSKVPSIVYQSNVQKIGWQSVVKDNALSGTVGKNLGVEAFRVSIQNLDMTGGIKYSTYTPNIGWQIPVMNNGISGTVGRNTSIQAVKMKLTDEISYHYDIYYRVYTQNNGWLGWAKNGGPAGSQQENNKIEGIQVLLLKKGNVVDTFYKRSFIDSKGSSLPGDEDEKF